MISTIKTGKMQAFDREAVSKVYTEGIATGFATFKTKLPTYEIWDAAHMP